MKKLIVFTNFRLICLGLLVMMAASCAHETELLHKKDENHIFRMDSSTSIRITSALLDTTSPEKIISSKWDNDYMRGTVSSCFGLE